MTAIEHGSRSRRLVDFPLVAMVVAILLYAAAAALAVAINSLLPPIQQGVKQAVEVLITLVLGYATYKIAIRHLGERPRDDLPARKALPGLALGLLTGFVIFSIVVEIAALAGSYRIVACCSTQDLVSDLFVAAIMPGFMEELFFRGILFRWIEEFAGSWAALAVTSVLFGLIHIMNPNATWFSSVAIALEAGVLLGGAYMLTRNLWVPIGLHAAWNFTQGFIFDVPVSGVAENGLVDAKLSGPVLLTGGQFGLEASVIALIVATSAGVWLVWLAARRGQLMPPSWVREPATA